MQVGKFNPVGKSHSGGTLNMGEISYPGFQIIFDFISAGSEPAITIPVDGDTDKEYEIVFRNTTPSSFVFRLNGDSGNNYGIQRLYNSAGTIGASRSAAENEMFYTEGTYSMGKISLLAPSGLIKTAFLSVGQYGYTSGTAFNLLWVQGSVWNNTGNVTSIFISPASGNFSSGTRITVFARRS